MTVPTDKPQRETAVSDELLGQRPVWGSFIGGSFADSRNAPRIAVLEAASGRPLAHLATADAATVDRAVTDSRTAYEAGWRDDADLDQAVTVAIEGMFYNQGEACTSTSRILVHSSLYDDFARLFVERTAALVVGDPLDPKTDIGPLVDARQRDRVLAYLETGINEGAELLYRGEAPQAPELGQGFFVPPAVLGGVTADMTVAQEEIFGPVASLMRFSTDEEAVWIANGTSYGLTAAIRTRDEPRASALARRLEAGMVFVNNYTRRTFIGSPFGGVKGSGFGREYAAETLREFVRAKNVRSPRAAA